MDFVNIFRKNVTYDNTKGNKKTGLYPSAEKYVLRKNMKGLTPLYRANLFRVKLCFNDLKTQIQNIFGYDSSKMNLQFLQLHNTNSTTSTIQYRTNCDKHMK